jgi:hypothetical protein
VVDARLPTLTPDQVLVEADCCLECGGPEAARSLASRVSSPSDRCVRRSRPALHLTRLR